MRVAIAQLNQRVGDPAGNARAILDAAAAGRRLVELLLARIRGEAAASMILPTRLVVRGSSVTRKDRA